MEKNIFIAGTGTDVGKTIASAIIVEAFGINYWKPVQAGALDNTDSMRVADLIKRKDIQIFPEIFRFAKDIAPHVAAKMDRVEMALDNFILPESARPIVIESAGGVLVPLNEKDYLMDLVDKFNANAIIVSKNYLGSINHSLLTWEALEKRNINILGWIFNGDENLETQNIIQQKSGRPCLLHIKNEKNMGHNEIRKYANEIASKNIPGFLP
ncbi:MAG: dethiobiotin synthase [Spirochaetia bacterium]|nr:dethiobiotin synthase [Spirochaetia bacterium]